MKQQKKWFKKRNEKRRKKVKRNVREAGESALDVSQVYDGMTIHIYFRIYIFKYIYSFQTVTRFDCQGGTHPERSMVVTRSLQEKKSRERKRQGRTWWWFHVRRCFFWSCVYFYREKSTSFLSIEGKLIHVSLHLHPHLTCNNTIF